MPTFTYKARDISGKSLSGSVVLADEKSAREYLRLRELYVTSLAAVSESTPLKATLLRRSVKLPDLVVFSRQFASMIKAGVPMMQTLGCLVMQTENPMLACALEEVRRDVESGVTLGAAVGRWPGVFPEMFIALVRAGEVSGNLDASLEAAASQFDKEHELREMVKSAFVYPTIVLCATALVVTILLTFVVPVFAKIYASMHAQLPIMTRMLLAASHALIHETPLVVLGIGGTVLLLRRAYKTDRGRLFFDRLKLRLPVLGKLNRKVALARFVRVLAALVESGLPLTRGLDLASQVTGNQVIGQAVRGVIDQINKGNPLSGPLEQTGQFPAMITRMVAVGEESGNLAMMLQEVAHFYDRDVEYTVKRLTSLLEPLLTAFLALVVGVVVISLYMPIFGLGQLLTHSQ